MRSQSAISLIEALVVLSLIAILTMITLPVLHHYVTATNDELLQSQLLQSIAFARQEAQALQIPVVLCKSNNRVNCSGAWTDGQLVFMDEDADGVVHEKDHILHVTQTVTEHGILHLRSYPYYRDYLLFQPGGFMPSDDSTFWYCRAANETPRWAIILNRSGRTRVVYPNKNGEVQDGKGNSLSCNSKA